MLANQSQEEAPIGAPDGPGSLNGRWEYKQVSPTVSLGLSAAKPVGRALVIIIGRTCVCGKDRFF